VLVGCVLLAQSVFADQPSLRSAYEAGLRKIDAESEQQRERLRQWYLTSLHALKQQAQQEGSLDKVTGVLDETKRFEKEQLVPVKPFSMPELHRLQVSYHNNISRFEVHCAQQVIDLTVRYNRELATLEKQLVRVGQIKEATAVREEREKLTESVPVTSAKKCLAKVLPSKTVLSPSAPRPRPSEPVTLDNVREITIPVHADKNIRVGGKVVTEGVYWLETDQTQGRIDLEFKDLRLSSLRPKIYVRLRLRIDNHEKAASTGTVEVYCGQRRVGSLRRAKADQWVEVNLDPKGIPNAMELKLRLIPRSVDGLAIRSKSTGMGPELRIRY